VHQDHYEQAHSRSVSGVLRCHSSDDDRESSGASGCRIGRDPDPRSHQPDLDTQVRVAPDGTISVPYVGRFRAAGLTEDVIAARIRKALTRAGILK
jgi:protein involved in polysaccharide export with SLBB domain